MNNKGFTLIELLATIMLLAIIMSITTVSIINLIESSKEKSYELLVEDIKIAAQGYFEECAGSNLIKTTIDCDTEIPPVDDDGIPNNNDKDGNSAIKNNVMIFSLNDLLKYGFLKAVDVENGNDKKIYNPNNNKDIGNCTIEIIKTVDNDTHEVTYTINRKTETISDGEEIIECPTY